MKIKNIILIIITVLVLGVSVSQGHSDIWYCPMHPNYTSDRPGQCPICGMDLVKKIEAPAQQKSTVEGYAVISVQASKQELIGVRTTIVTKNKGAIIVPRDAVMDTGARKIVFVQKDEETFEPREIQTGREADNGYEVISGLKEGEHMVVSGNFLLDSQSRMQASLEQGG